ncbi:MAG: hypothetical protein HY000_40270 [Planctomycetes bacterium]|nr:hypothetical protein [Planctomycetota bacterium]
MPKDRSHSSAGPQPGRPMNPQASCERLPARHARLSSFLIAVISVVRGLPLFLSARPKTPLRVLCLMAFDTLHLLRHAKRLPRHQLRTLAAVLDFAACANAAFDNKDYRQDEYRATLRLLEEAGIGPSVAEYLRRLSALERSRPSPGGDLRQFQIVRLYREAVVRLSLGMAATAAMGGRRLDDAIRATECEADLNLLFRIAMQCQIVDDVLDYSKDLSAGLPSFLTASESLPQALELTRLAALGYADARDVPRTADVFPLRAALWLVSTCTKLVIIVACWRERTRRRVALVALACRQCPRREGIRIARTVMCFGLNNAGTCDVAAQCSTDGGVAASAWVATDVRVAKDTYALPSG